MTRLILRAGGGGPMKVVRGLGGLHDGSLLSLDVPPGTLNAILKQAGLKKEK